jgi:hypothetical protein
MLNEKTFLSSLRHIKTHTATVNLVTAFAEMVTLSLAVTTAASMNEGVGMYEEPDELLLPSPVPPVLTTTYMYVCMCVCVCAYFLHLPCK